MNWMWKWTQTTKSSSYSCKWKKLISSVLGVNYTQCRRAAFISKDHPKCKWHFLNRMHTMKDIDDKREIHNSSAISIYFIFFWGAIHNKIQWLLVQTNDIYDFQCKWIQFLQSFLVQVFAVYKHLEAKSPNFRFLTLEFISCKLILNIHLYHVWRLKAGNWIMILVTAAPSHIEDFVSQIFPASCVFMKQLNPLASHNECW